MVQDTFNQKKILVVGDIMLDIYCHGSVTRISPEAPVPVFNKKSERYVLGGAANVAANLSAAGCEVSLFSACGDDDNGKKIIQLLQDNGIDTGFVVQGKKPTITKTRFMATGHQQLMRLDVEDISDIAKEEYEPVLNMLKSCIGEFDLVLMSDYLKGMLSSKFTQEIIQLAEDNHIKVLIDVKDKNTDKYKGAYLLKPNKKELMELTGMNVVSIEDVIDASRVLMEKCHTEYVLTTCGEKGMVLVGNNDEFKISSEAKEVFDVTGAGDTTIAYLAVGLINGLDIKDAVVLANRAAGIQVGKLGTSIVTMEELQGDMPAKRNLLTDKIVNLSGIVKLREKLHNKKIVFTNGCFDILHIGHITYLQQAAKLGDVLVIGVNSDASVKRLKGNDRPVNAQNDRVKMLCALECVDYVVVFDEDTPYDLISMVQPDILVKGGDYKAEDVVGKDIVEGRGGCVEIIPLVEGISTTSIIQRIKE